MLDCQCRQCQQESGTGHASHLVFPSAGSSVKGEATVWNAVGEGGTVKSRAFCPRCGSPVYMTFPGNPDVLVVRAGSLDDPSLYAPQLVTWTASGQAWDHLDPALSRFEKMPPA
jgi:hypothetical protein